MMRTRQRKFSIALLFIACSLSVALATPAHDFERKITEQYSISENGSVEMHNRYGNVDVETWSGSEVKIEVIITVDARNQEKADEVFDRIDINFSNSASFVKAETEINTNKNWSRWFGSNSDKFQINYHVWLPESVEVNVNNKYGDVYIAEITNDANVTVKYGNIRLDGIGGELNLTMGYSKGSVTSAGSLSLDMSYSTLNCGDLGNVRIDSKYSNFKANTAGHIQSTSSYDHYAIKKAIGFSNNGKYDDMSFDELSEVNMNTKYSHLDVGQLKDKADLVFRYGGVKIGYVSPNFSHIDITGDYAGISMDVDPAAQFNVEAVGRYCSIKYSDLEVYHDVQSNNESVVKGYRGNKEGGGRISASMKYGHFKIN